MHHSRSLTGASIVLATLLLSACDRSPVNDDAATTAGAQGRPTATMLQDGKAAYSEHCARCHGNRGQGDFSWRKKDASGLWPPPPLDGSGHAWHHSWAALTDKIRNGARPGQGRMPAFGTLLNDAEINNILYWLQSLWPAEVYQNWRQRQAGGQ